MSSTLRQARLRTTDRISPQVAEKTQSESVSDALIERVRKRLYDSVGIKLLADQSDENRKRIHSVIVAAVRNESTERLPAQKEALLVHEIENDLFGYGPIQSLIDDATVTEIMINRYDKVYYEKHGIIQHAQNIKFRDSQHLYSVIQKIVGPIGRHIDESSPMVDARLPDGSRVNAVIPPLALDGPCLAIRRFGQHLTAEEFVNNRTIDKKSLNFLADCIRGKVNILITGGTGSGKSTFLNILSAYIPENERVITIEDSAELQLQRDHVVRFESRPPNIEGKGEVTIRALVKNALRQRPDRIIVGEARGGEALDLLQAMSTGHEGSLSTIHANNTQESITRLAMMVLMAEAGIPQSTIMELIASAVDMIVHLSRMRDGSRKVIEISEVSGIHNDVVKANRIFAFKMNHETSSETTVYGHLEPTGMLPKRIIEKCLWRGIRFDKDMFDPSPKEAEE